MWLRNKKKKIETEMHFESGKKKFRLKLNLGFYDFSKFKNNLIDFLKLIFLFMVYKNISPLNGVSPGRRDSDQQTHQPIQ
jgi:hypothetical protein